MGICISFLLWVQQLFIRLAFSLLHACSWSTVGGKLPIASLSAPAHPALRLLQDCTVQHLRNELAAEVYEAHARASLEYGDLAEFNQCQTQLASLYGDGVKGCVAEFAAYRVLYNAAHARSGANKALLSTMKGALTLMAGDAGAAAASGPAAAAVSNALAARQAAFASDYPGFFRAYAAAPALGRALMDIMAPRLRWAALNVLVRSYKAPLPVSFVASMLGFCPVKQKAGQAQAKVEQGVSGQVLPGCRAAVYAGKAAAEATEEEGVAACVRWLRAHGAVVEEPAAGEGEGTGCCFLSCIAHPLSPVAICSCPALLALCVRCLSAQQGLA